MYSINGFAAVKRAERYTGSTEVTEPFYQEYDTLRNDNRSLEYYLVVLCVSDSKVEPSELAKTYQTKQRDLPLVDKER